MKVVQLNNWCRGFGGIEVMVEATIKTLKQRGVEVSIMARRSNDLPPGLKGKVRAFFSGIYSVNENRRMANFLRTNRPDIVHVHHLYPLFSPSVLVACQRARVPVVMTCHSYFLTCPTYMHLKDAEVCERCSQGREYWCIFRNCRDNILESIAYALRAAVARRFRLFHKNITLFVAVSEFMQNKLVEAGFPEQSIVVLPNMVYALGSGLKARAGDYVAYAGRFSREKGIETLLAAARQAALPVWLAGDYSTMPSIAEKAPPNVRFKGHLDRQRLAEFYRNARFLVVPSICYESFGLVAAEAMSHSLPVIASRIGGLPEVVEDGINGLLFEPGNAEELASKMKLLWENPEMCQQMGKAGREKAIRECSEDVYYERLMGTYNKAIEIHNSQIKSKDTSHAEH